MYASRFCQFSETAGGLDSCGFEAPCGEGSGACVHPFSFVIRLFFLPFPYFCISYLGLVLSSSRQRVSGLCYSSVHWEYIAITLANSLSKLSSFGLLIFQ